MDTKEGRWTMETNVRAHVVISGRVQGVFFRAETQRAAQRLGVAGWVRNRFDGTVEALFEGPTTKVHQAVDWCWQGSPMANVSDVSVQWEDYTGEFDDFSITY
jgi:acylphosphatase